VFKTIVEQANAKGIFTQAYQSGVLSFLIFWYFFAQFFISSFALLYYRKYKDQ
jgi:hypothetical protein